MKTKVFTLISVLFIFTSLSSCKKEIKDTQSGNLLKSISSIDGLSIRDLNLNDIDLTDEEKLFINNMKNGTKKRHIALYSTSNQGNLLSNNQAFSIKGNFYNDIELSIANIHISSTEFGSNMISHYNPDLQNIFGTTQTFSLKTNNANENKTNYIPTPIQANLTVESSGKLDLDNNSMLSWNPDPNNKLSFVLLRYTTMNGINSAFDGDVLLDKLIILEDDGSFDLRSIINGDEHKSLQLSLTRGTATSVDDVLFTMSTSDHHIYMLN